MSGTTGASGNLLGEDAVISCPHGGRVTTATPSNGPVLLNGVPVLTGAHTHVVAGCPHTVDGVPSPCVAVRFTAEDTGITVDGAPVLLDTSAAQCFSAASVAQGPPFVQATQREVTVP
ncbi:hypothetical protein OOK13_05080 [Streptomyces sp. NBC_00378]|uniref:hypothetical protein n=1 Tax=unclassified Streptomyces TaxID=2593676 RepID=UPI0022548599|nr:MULTISPECIES: hypothetical protein [unclassified Streptomyces]MCX5107899.1 hypothetical protein [Streptomyces sp. NBC_00378]